MSDSSTYKRTHVYTLALQMTTATSRHLDFVSSLQNEQYARVHPLPGPRAATARLPRRAALRPTRVCGARAVRRRAGGQMFRTVSYIVYATVH
jgi:hypothetical protein